MTNSKMTKRDYFEQIMANYALTEAEKAFVEHEIELLSKRSVADHKPSKAQIANENVKTAIAQEMVPDVKYTISDMLKNFECVADMSSQKISALVKQMKDDGIVVRIEEKGKAYFTLA